MKKILIILLFLIIGNQVYTQSGEKPCADKKTDSLFPAILTAQSLKSINSVPREQFIDEWRKGDIYLINGETARDRYINYNGYSDELYWMRSLDYKIGQLYRKDILGFCFYADQERKQKIFYKISVPDLIQNRNIDVFAEQLVEDRISFYCQRNLNMLNNSGDVYPKYKYYIRQGNQLYRIILRKSSLLKIFPESEHQHIKKVIRKNHLKVKQEEDMVRFIKIMNSLQSP
jgi:hypothetical protein